MQVDGYAGYRKLAEGGDVRLAFCAEHWATIALLIGNCKLNDVDPLMYLTDVLTRIVNGHPNSAIDQLPPWAYPKQDLRAVA